VRSFDHWVITRRRVNADIFPFTQLIELRKSPWRLLNRAWHRTAGRRVPLDRFETDQMLEFCRKRSISLVHVYLGTEALRILSFLRQFQGARVVSFHGMDLSDDLAADAYAPLWNSAERFLCRSQSLREQLLARGCPANRIRLNYTGVPVPEFIAAPHLPDWRNGQPVRVLQACRFIEKKGLDVTLHAIRLLKNAGFPVCLTLAGEGPVESSLRALARELGIDDRVSFAGFLTEEQLTKEYGRHDAFVHPSRTTAKGDREGIPNALLEAMAHGLPVISTRHSGIPEAVTDRHDGLLIDEADAALMAKAMRDLIENPELHERLSSNARETVSNRFSLTANAAALEATYNEALTARTPDQRSRSFR
jgi:colanic acid/amylovoran biosynthesis glycosyltransferase